MPLRIFKQAVSHKKVAETEALQLSLWHIKLFGFLVVGFEWIKKVFKNCKVFQLPNEGRLLWRRSALSLPAFRP